MKVRRYFVSNSSSSSFTCAVCGATESGWDVSLADIGMYECGGCGSYYCENHAVGKLSPTYKPESDEEQDELDDFNRYEVPAEYCPICTLNFIEKSTKLEYLLRKYNLEEEDVEMEIRSKYRNLTDFQGISNED